MWFVTTFIKQLIVIVSFSCKYKVNLKMEYMSFN